MFGCFLKMSCKTKRKRKESIRTNFLLEIYFYSINVDCLFSSIILLKSKVKEIQFIQSDHRFGVASTATIITLYREVGFADSCECICTINFIKTAYNFRFTPNNSVLIKC